jgi:hypothetical protein
MFGTPYGHGLLQELSERGQISRRSYRAMAELLQRLSRRTVQTPLAEDVGPMGTNLRIDLDPPLDAQVTAVGGPGNAHSWIEVARQLSGTTGIAGATPPLFAGAGWVDATTANGLSGACAQTITGTTNSNTTITGLTSTAGLVVGQTVTDADGDVPASTTIVSVDSSSQVTISNAATGSHSNNAITFDRLNPLYERNGAVIPVGTYVHIWRGYWDWPTSVNGQEWIATFFNRPPPVRRQVVEEVVIDEPVIRRPYVVQQQQQLISRRPVIEEIYVDDRVVRRGLPPLSLCKTRVKNSTSQSVSTTTNQALVFDTNVVDTCGQHSTSSNTSRITFGKQGKQVVYAFISATESSPTSGDVVELTIKLNGTTILATADMCWDFNGTSSFITAFIWYDGTFNANDYVEVYFNNESSTGMATLDNTCEFDSQAYV